jgi:hypothetical protein
MVKMIAVEDASEVYPQAGISSGHHQSSGSQIELAARWWKPNTVCEPDGEYVELRSLLANWTTKRIESA